MADLAKLPSLEQLCACSSCGVWPAPCPYPRLHTASPDWQVTVLSQLLFHLHFPNYECGWASLLVLWSHLYFLLRDEDYLNMMGKVILLAASPCLGLSVSWYHIFPKVDEAFLGGGEQDTIVLDLGVAATYSG